MVTWTRRRWAGAALVIGLAVVHPAAPVIPKLTRVAVLINPARRPSVTEVDSAAARLGVQIEWVEITGPEMLDALRRRLRALQVHGIHTVESPLIDGIAPRIGEIAREQRLPSVFPFREAVEGGGLMSYATSFAETQRRAPSYPDSS